MRKKADALVDGLCGPAPDAKDEGVGRLRRFYEEYGRVLGGSAIRNFDEVEQALRSKGYLDRILKEEVDTPLDHRNLNRDVPEFANAPPTAENLAVWIWRRVSARIGREGWPCRLAALSLRLTPDFAVEIERGPAED